MSNHGSGSNPIKFLVDRESGSNYDIRTNLFDKRLDVAKNLYRRDLVCHYGCVNALEFSDDGELLISGGDDRRVMLWKFGQALFNKSKPETMKNQHSSNIFCLAFSQGNRKILSGGNDNEVIIHDTETKGAIDLLPHNRAVCGLSVDPFNDHIVSTAGNDGRLLLFDTRQSVHESMVLSRSRKAFYAVQFHPQQNGLIVSANARDGAALWDLRALKNPAVRYSGNNGTSQYCMSVRFNNAGNKILALRRRLPPALYSIDNPEPEAEFYHQDYYNSCTMKSCCFAGENDQFVLSGSDDFNLYMWKIPESRDSFDTVVDPPHIILYGHRSIVNQVRYNPHFCVIASSGVEKIIKLWSGVEYPDMKGCLLEESQGPDNPRETYTQEDYVYMVRHGGQYISHNYSEQSTNEDPRMMAFFDSLVRREMDGYSHESDSHSDSDTSALPHSHRSDTSDSERNVLVDFLPLPPKRVTTVGGRNQRNHSRIVRLLSTRNSHSLRTPSKRGPLSRRSKLRTFMSNPKKSTASASAKMSMIAALKGKRDGQQVASASSERTDSDEPHSHYTRTRTGKIIRPLRRRMNMSRTLKRKTRISSGRGLRNTTNGLNNNGEAIPSTSTGYRGNTASLFRISEAESEEEIWWRSGPRSLSVSPTPPHVQTLARLMNETNESELDSSRSTSPAPRRYRHRPRPDS